MGILIRLLLIVSWVFLSSTQPAFSQDNKILIVTNADDIGLLNRQQIKQIYMKGQSPNLKPISLKQGNKTRVIFNSTVIGLTESRINSYWIQMKFSGKAEPPIEFDNTQDIIQQLKSQTRSIAYLPLGIEIPKTLHIIHTLEY